MSGTIIYVPIIRTNDHSFIRWAIENLRDWCNKKIFHIDDDLPSETLKARYEWDRALEEIADWCMDKVPDYTIDVLAATTLHTHEIDTFTIDDVKADDKIPNIAGIKFPNLQ